MASDFIREGGANRLAELCTFTEKRQIVKAKQNRWKILKGNKYIRQSVKYEGRIYTFKAIPDMHKLCLKYDWYPEQ